MAVTRKTKRVGGVTIALNIDVADSEQIASVLWRPGGSGDTDLKRRASLVAARAAQTAPVGKTGDLSRSFSVRQARAVTGRFQAGYEVISSSPYLFWVIKGTRPHPIEGRPLLVFDWPKAGLHPAVFRRVNHPGTRANSFFADAVHAAV